MEKLHHKVKAAMRTEVLTIMTFETMEKRLPVSCFRSSTCYSRVTEEVQLKKLNDRLATYIDRVRNLGTENSRLNIEVQTTRETVTRETTNLKNMSEAELLETRRLLDNMTRGLARDEIDIKRLWEENRLKKETKECSTSEENARMSESRFNELSKFNLANADRKKITDELIVMTKELDHQEKELDNTCDRHGQEVAENEKELIRLREAMTH
ncbi:lamin Dm0-like [Drosophila eugracilis]|uniref:lamin Dm0-like n=1 Tax=Drosophila eugracilis TaxID=29029 RepID=UPI001BDA89D1|nr:lamin Dm0-like [Drosophila eugracilis]